jgi:hypothetical protein
MLAFHARRDHTPGPVKTHVNISPRLPPFWHSPRELIPHINSSPTAHFAEPNHTPSASLLRAQTPLCAQLWLALLRISDEVVVRELDRTSSRPIRHALFLVSKLFSSQTDYLLPVQMLYMRSRDEYDYETKGVSGDGEM